MAKYLFERLPAEQKEVLLQDENLMFVDITPTARWFYEQDEKETYDWENDFPCLIPPGNSVWMEWRNTNKGFAILATGEHVTPEVSGIGVAMYSLRVPEDERETYLKHDVLCLSLQQMLKSRLTYDEEDFMHIRKQLIEKALLEGKAAHWLTDWHTFVFGRRKCIPFCSRVTYLDQYGRLVNPVLSSSITPHAHLTEPDLGDIFVPLAFAVSLLHCKNVRLVNVEIPPKIKAARKKKGRLHEFKTLKVEPMREKIRKISQDSGNKIEKRFHFVRGHFKDYRESGLFGKNFDMYWWEQHARGDPSLGRIDKTYELNR